MPISGTLLEKAWRDDLLTVLSKEAVHGCATKWALPFAEIGEKRYTETPKERIRHGKLPVL